MADEIIKVLDDLSRRFGIAVDWSSQNMMPYLQTLGNKLVHYEIGMAILWIVIGILCICSVKFWNKKYKQAKEDCDYDLECLFELCAVLFFVCGVGFIIWKVPTIITGITFPEKLIVEKGLDMLKEYRR